MISTPHHDNIHFLIVNLSLQLCSQYWTAMWRTTGLGMDRKIGEQEGVLIIQLRLAPPIHRVIFNNTDQATAKREYKHYLQVRFWKNLSKGGEGFPWCSCLLYCLSFISTKEGKKENSLCETMNLHAKHQLYVIVVEDSLVLPGLLQ